jgi:cytidylate kinase
VQRKRADADFDYVKTEIEVRDQRDQQRAVAPLKVPAGALVIDNSAMTLEQTIEAFARIIDPTIC